MKIEEFVQFAKEKKLTPVIFISSDLLINHTNINYFNKLFNKLKPYKVDILNENNIEEYSKKRTKYALMRYGIFSQYVEATFRRKGSIIISGDLEI